MDNSGKDCVGQSLVHESACSFLYVMSQIDAKPCQSGRLFSKMNDVSFFKSA